MRGRLHASAVLIREGSRLQPLNGWLAALQRWSAGCCKETFSLPYQESSCDFTVYQRVLDALLSRDSVVRRLASSWTVRGSNLGGVRFSAFVHTISGAHPASSYTMGTACFPGVKRPGRGVDHPPPSGAEIKKE